MSTHADTSFTYPTLFRSDGGGLEDPVPLGARRRLHAAVLRVHPARGAAAARVHACAVPGRRERAAAARRPGTGADRRAAPVRHRSVQPRSEEHTSELQSLMRISYAVFCLKKKNIHF